jgi:hypothetical protein
MQSLIRYGLLIAASFGLLAPVGSVWADETAKQSAIRRETTVMTDVALRAGGELVGFRIGADGGGMSETVVVVHQILHETPKPEPIKTSTDADGRFSITGLRGGVYYIESENGAACCRLWAPGTAPPKARDLIVLTDDDPVVRGKSRRSRGTLITPARVLFTAAAAGGAIAVGASRSHRSEDLSPVTP